MVDDGGTIRLRNRKSLDDLASQGAVTTTSAHPMDSDPALEELRTLLGWYYYERDRQASNRLEMHIDHEFYDGQQYAEEDQATLEDRKQLPVVHNYTAATCDWMIGTERRNRVDWKVLPRTEDDVGSAATKTSVLKYFSDVNRSAWQRSRAFSDAIKGGEGYTDTGVRDDPTKEPIYDAYEDWRCVLMDSERLDPLGSDARYVFRWRHVDEDIALAMFPDRADAVRRSLNDWAWFQYPNDEEFRLVGGYGSDMASRPSTMARPIGVSTSVEARRRKLRILEAQYRKPVTTRFVAEGPFRGAMFDERDNVLADHVARGGYSIVDRITMRVWTAVFTEAAMMRFGPSRYRHNQFSLTPYVCYRRGSDRMPYGMVRRVRSLQQDINKRGSKSLHLLNTTQLVADADAFEDWDEAGDEVQRPDGRLAHKKGAKVEIRTGAELSAAQANMMDRGVMALRTIMGVNDENLGLQTNAVSGEAIKARQIQGSVSTTEPFDNARWATQAHGQKQLSMAEQFVTAPRVFRLTGLRGALEWVRVNRPEVQADGSVRFLDDITASMADFIVSEQDYAGSLRQVMFDSMTQLSQRLPPELALKFLRMAFEYSDLPNKQDIADELRKLTGEADPSKPMSPEEQRRIEEQQRKQAEAEEIQRQTALAVLEQQRAKARELNAKAEKLMTEMHSAAALGDGSMADVAQASQAAMQVQAAASNEIERLSGELSKAHGELLKARTSNDALLEGKRIDADTKLRIAEIQRDSNDRLRAINDRIEALAEQVRSAKSRTGAKPKE